MHLHELLAVESNLENQANKARADLSNTFEKKRHLFESKRVVFTPAEEGAPQVVELQSDIQTTVAKELDWIQGFLTKSLDASYQVAETNTKARADVVLEDDAETVLLQDVPATALLELEKRLTELGTFVAGIPTLDPAKGFKPDSANNLFVANPITKNRTKKVKDVLVKYPATKEHPAQTEVIDKDVVTSTIQEQEWSGFITPAKKSELINKVEIVSRAVRRARAKANDTEVDKSKKIARKLLEYIFG